MRKNPTITFLGCFFAAVVNSSAVLADVVPNPPVLRVYPGAAPLSVEGQPVGTTLEVYTILDRSYCCTLEPVTADPFEDASGLQLLYRTEVSANTGLLFNPPITRGPDTRMCWIDTPNTHNGAVQVGSMKLGLKFRSGSNGANVRCDDTSIGGPFNTNSSDHSFLEIVSNQAEQFKVQIVGTSVNGLPLFRQIITLQGRADILLDPLVGENQIGSILISHDAPAGSVDAYVAEYRIDPSNTKAGFTLVGRQKFGK